MSYYQKHIFLCHNLKQNDRKCCAQGQPEQMRDYLKSRLREYNLLGEGKCRVTYSGCMGRCAEGPILVIYPQSLWYTYHSKEDIEKILQTSILSDGIVDELLL